MSIILDVRLPSQLVDQATSVAGTDLLTIQRVGETRIVPVPVSVLLNGAMSTSHPANPITGFGDEAQPLWFGQWGGDSTKVSRANHVHPFPTAANVGAMSTSHPANSITGFGDEAQPLWNYQWAGNSTQVSRANHMHPFPTAANVGAAATNGSLGINFNVNNLGTGSGYIYRYTADADQANLSMGDYWNRMRFRNNQGFNFQLLNGSWGDIECHRVTFRAITDLSDPRLKAGIIRGPALSAPADIEALSDQAVIEFAWDGADANDRKLGFDAQKIAQLFPLASVHWTPDPDSPEAKADLEGDLYGFDPIALLAVVVRELATLKKRVDVLERAKRP